MKTILFLAANPQQMTELRLGEELRDIDEGLKMSAYRDQFRLEQRLALRPRDLHRAMLTVNPQIVHFAGQADRGRGLVLEARDGTPQVVDTDALASLFALFVQSLNCVVLNACYSEVQATAIAQHIPYVIGIGEDIERPAAKEFAVGFYDALGAGREVEFAYGLGCSALRLAGHTTAPLPVLKVRSGRPTSTIEPFK